MIRKARRNRIHDFEPWLHLIYALWFIVWGTVFLTEGNLVGILSALAGAAFGVLGVWGIWWRWKADIEWNLLQANTWVDGYMTGMETIVKAMKEDER